MLPRFTVVDDFLPEDQFEKVKELFYSTTENQIPWNFIADGFDEETDIHTHYLVHTCYYQTITSGFYDYLAPIFIPKFQEHTSLRSMIRMKFNCYPSAQELVEHPMHIDTDYPSQGALFSINTCDGYTKMKSGKKIQSVANRMLFFDSGSLHCSSNCTNDKARFNLIYNYL